jgi:DNA polymerase III epsilon subunit-like protein
VAVGFAVANDVRALRKNCERYGLAPLRFRAFDTERLCRLLEEHREVRGLGNCVVAWCGEEPENRHRSDGDALATMMLLRAICKAKHATPEMLLTAYPACLSSSLQSPKKHPHGRRHGRGRPVQRRQNGATGNAKDAKAQKTDAI